MTKQELIDLINEEMTLSCALPYALNSTEVARLIDTNARWCYANYREAIEERYLAIPTEVFTDVKFKSQGRFIVLPECVRAVYEFGEIKGGGGSLAGTPDRDFADTKLIGSDVLMNPFVGDNLVYRTAMLSYYDLAIQFFTIKTIEYRYNYNTKRLAVLGRTPEVAAYAKVAIDINPEHLYDDEIFIRMCYARAKMELGRLLGMFTYQLPGGVQINFADIKQEGTDEMNDIKQQIKDEDSADWFIKF
jgi:hypothetical protein